jgi:hypothetical protein
MGLREKIKSAKSDSEVACLLQDGFGYAYASNKTKNAWKATAKRTLSSLSAPKPSKPAVEVVGEVTGEVAPKKKSVKPKRI